MHLRPITPAEVRARGVYTRAATQPDPRQPWRGEEEILEQELETIRAQGYGCTHGRRIPGAVGTAAPIFDNASTVLGDVIVTVPEQRFAEHDEGVLAKHVIRAAEAITKVIGGRRVH